MTDPAKDAERLAAKQWIESRPNGYSLSASDVAAYVISRITTLDVTIARLTQERNEARRSAEANASDAAAATDMQNQACAAQDFIISKGLWGEFSDKRGASRREGTELRAVIEAACLTYDDLVKWRELPPEERNNLLPILSRLGKALNEYEDDLAARDAATEDKKAGRG